MAHLQVHTIAWPCTSQSGDYVKYSGEVNPQYNHSGIGVILRRLPVILVTGQVTLVLKIYNLPLQIKVKVTVQICEYT